MDWIELIDNQGNAVIPKRLKRVAKYAFKDCKDLKSIVIPSGVTTIAESAFLALSMRERGAEKIRVQILKTDQ